MNFLQVFYASFGLFVVACSLCSSFFLGFYFALSDFFCFVVPMAAPLLIGALQSTDQRLVESAGPKRGGETKNEGKVGRKGNAEDVKQHVLLFLIFLFFVSVLFVFGFCSISCSAAFVILGCINSNGLSPKSETANKDIIFTDEK